MQSFQEEHKKVMDSMEAKVKLIKRNCKRLRDERERSVERARLRIKREAERKRRESDGAPASKSPEPFLEDNSFADIEPASMQVIFSQADVDARNEILSPLGALLREAPFGCEVLDDPDDVGEYDPVESLLEGPTFCDFIRVSGVGWVNRAVIDALFDVMIFSTESAVVHGTYRVLQVLLDRDYQGWMPDVECFTRFFKKCGYVCDGAAMGWEEIADHRAVQKKDKSAPDLTKIKVRLLLSCLPLVTASSSCSFIPRGGTEAAVQLVCMLVHFSLDLSAHGFREELSEALEAVLGCVDGRRLSGLTEDMVKGLVELGPTHRSQLQLLDRACEESTRARSFKRLWMMASLRRIVPDKAPLTVSSTDSQPSTCLTGLMELMHNPTTLISIFEQDYKANGGEVIPLDWWLSDTMLGLVDKLLHLCLNQDDAPVSSELEKQVLLVWVKFRDYFSDYSRVHGSFRSAGSARVQCRLKLLKLAWDVGSYEEAQDFWE